MSGHLTRGEDISSACYALHLVVRRESIHEDLAYANTFFTKCRTFLRLMAVVHRLEPQMDHSVMARNANRPGFSEQLRSGGTP